MPKSSDGWVAAIPAFKHSPQLKHPSAENLTRIHFLSVYGFIVISCSLAFAVQHQARLT
jgi:hypothetical protein